MIDRDPLTEVLAQAICEGFWEAAEGKVDSWATSSQTKRDVFRNCARHAIRAARVYKRQQENVT